MTFLHESANRKIVYCVQRATLNWTEDEGETESGTLGFPTLDFKLNTLSGEKKSGEKKSGESDENFEGVTKFSPDELKPRYFNTRPKL